MFISLPLRQRPRVPIGWDQASPGRTRTLAGPGPAVRRGRVSRSKHVRPFVKRTVFGTLTGRLESFYCCTNNITYISALKSPSSAVQIENCLLTSSTLQALYWLLEPPQGGQ